MSVQLPDATLRGMEERTVALVTACNKFVKAHKIRHYLCEASEIRVSGRSYAEFKAAIVAAEEKVL